MGISIVNDGFAGSAPELAAISAAIEAAVAAVDGVDASTANAGSKVRSANLVSAILVGGATLPFRRSTFAIARTRASQAPTTASRRQLPHGALLAAAILAQQAIALVSVNGASITSDTLGVSNFSKLGEALGFA